MKSALTNSVVFILIGINNNQGWKNLLKFVQIGGEQDRVVQSPIKQTQG